MSSDSSVVIIGCHVVIMERDVEKIDLHVVKIAIHVVIVKLWNVISWLQLNHDIDLLARHRKTGGLVRQHHSSFAFENPGFLNDFRLLILKFSKSFYSTFHLVFVQYYYA
ncbi:hypothetical protein [Paenisporosarcina sp. TG-14]|uniref:hypothetical protein n=1 Tax=Paenisporosarcina sp. TG-14 TaxID=1231057 RepID=UPI00038107D5|nr:hypothetical protein [Paenisporosarcina sp. TG-14]